MPLLSRSYSAPIHGCPSPASMAATLAVLHRGQALQVRMPRQGFADRSCFVPAFDLVQSGEDLAGQLLVLFCESPRIA